MIVYVLYNPRVFTRERVVAELRSEKYKHKFFISERQDAITKSKCLRLADEVWCFGRCEQLHDYKMAKELGKDVWYMG